MIAVGSKFIVHWKGHESCYEGRVYQVKSIYKNCETELLVFGGGAGSEKIAHSFNGQNDRMSL